MSVCPLGAALCLSPQAPKNIATGVDCSLKAASNAKGTRVRGRGATRADSGAAPNHKMLGLPESRGYPHFEIVAEDDTLPASTPGAEWSVLGSIPIFMEPAIRRSDNGPVKISKAWHVVQTGTADRGKEGLSSSGGRYRT